MRAVLASGILFDLDGVIYNAEDPIPGAAESVAWVRSRGIPFLFVTNTTSKNRHALMEKLRGMGIEADVSHILTPCVAASDWLRAQGRGPVALFVREAARGEFAGLDLAAEGAEEGATDVVIGDLGEAWDYKTMNRAFRLLYHGPDTNLIALGMTRFWQTAEGLCLDVAPFVAALEHATGRRPIVFGKPAEAFFRAAAERLGVPIDQIVMIGDDVRADIGGAKAAGLKGALVQTGKFRPGDLDGAIRPDAVLATVADVPAWWGAADVG